MTSTEHTIALEVPLPRALADEFAKRVYFAAEEIHGFRLVGDDEKITALVVRTPGALPERLAEKVNFLLRNDVLPQLVRDPKVVWRSEATREYPADTFDRLVEHGAAHQVGEGQIVLADPVLGLMDDLDRLLRDIVLTEFGGREYRYPTLIPIDALDRCNYFTSFPQYAMFATRLKSDVDNYRAFVERAGAGDVRGEILAHCADVDYCLPPTMCYHTFHQLLGSTITGDPTVVTARGKSFRHESRYHRSLARLWDFTIREIVFLGARDEVVGARERFLRRGLDLAEALELTGRCEVASDPFFVNTDSGARATSQRLLELKYELQLDLAPGDSVAVGSFNFHEKFFGEAFELTRPDGAAPFSGCVGFGLERFAFAFVCQHGIDPGGWPEPVRHVLSARHAPQGSPS